MRHLRVLLEQLEQLLDVVGDLGGQGVIPFDDADVDGDESVALAGLDDLGAREALDHDFDVLVREA